MTTAFLFNDKQGGPHWGGDSACPACDEGYPHPCDLTGCESGLMHAHVDERRGAETILASRCDQCGRDLSGAD